MNTQFWKLALLASAVCVSCCESQPDGGYTKPEPTPVPTATSGPVATPSPTPPPVIIPDYSSIGSFTSTGHAGMDSWRLKFSRKALDEGFRVETIRSVLADIEPMSIFLQRSAGIVDQAEFSKPIWEYVGDTVSNSRLNTGREKLQSDASLFVALYEKYGIQPEYLAAIWGMETSYGAVIGNFDAPSALASMAVEGRRQTFAESELLSLMRILERGDAERDWLIAGWAGAMGQTQFMPSTYYAYAVDWTGDGTKDVWHARADALASAGNYLKASGWRTGEPAIREVFLPQGFDYALADGLKRNMTSWQALGVLPMIGDELAPRSITEAELWLPAGATGPAFLLFPNFNTIKSYNRADSYALAVSLIAENLRGPKVPSAPWPVDIDRLNIVEVKELQASLNTLGYNAGPVDGIAGRGTRKALQDFQKANAMMADGYPTHRALNAVRAAL